MQVGREDRELLAVSSRTARLARLVVEAVLYAAVGIWWWPESVTVVGMVAMAAAGSALCKAVIVGYAVLATPVRYRADAAGLHIDHPLRGTETILWSAVRRASMEGRVVRVDLSGRTVYVPGMYSNREGLCEAINACVAGAGGAAEGVSGRARP